MRSHEARWALLQTTKALAVASDHPAVGAGDHPDRLAHPVVAAAADPHPLPAAAAADDVLYDRPEAVVVDDDFCLHPEAVAAGDGRLRYRMAAAEVAVADGGRPSRQAAEAEAGGAHLCHKAAAVGDALCDRPEAAAARHDRRAAAAEDDGRLPAAQNCATQAMHKY